MSFDVWFDHQTFLKIEIHFETTKKRQSFTNKIAQIMRGIHIISNQK